MECFGAGLQVKPESDVLSAYVNFEWWTHITQLQVHHHYMNSITICVLLGTLNSSTKHIV